MNKSISDIIEEFIINSLEDEDFIELSRNDLAKFFSCVPSQINYVLNTRFTPSRGFAVQSQRGGAGYVKLVRVKDTADNFLSSALSKTSTPISLPDAEYIVENMASKKIISTREAELIKCVIGPKAVSNPFNMDSTIRSNILHQIVLKLMEQNNKSN